jgi:hypothetical protein
MPLILISYLLAVVFAGLIAVYPGAGVILFVCAVSFLLVGACFHALHNWCREQDRREAEEAERLERNVMQVMHEQNQRLARFTLFADHEEV